MFQPQQVNIYVFLEAGGVISPRDTHSLFYENTVLSYNDNSVYVQIAVSLVSTVFTVPCKEGANIDSCSPLSEDDQAEQGCELKSSEDS